MRVPQDAVRWLLVCVLLTTAALKLQAGFGRIGAANVAAVVEVLLAAGLVIPTSRHWALLACLGGFAGATLVGLSAALEHNLSAPCGCLGQVDLSRSQALVLQGCIMLLALTALRLAAPSEPAIRPGPVQR